MKTYIMALKDAKLGVYGQPQAVQSPGLGARAFEDAQNDPERKTDISKHPEDFSLWQLATYDDETGLFENNKPHLIMQGKQNV
ncbi:MAG: nonstructural protein [Microviridae sp.]|nr:MAG: nonstructural protein [Microviridae sp.]